MGLTKKWMEYEHDRVMERIDEILTISARGETQSRYIAPNAVIAYLTIMKGFSKDYTKDFDQHYLTVVLTHPTKKQKVKLLINIDSAFQRGFTLIKPRDGFV